MSNDCIKMVCGYGEHCSLISISFQTCDMCLEIYVSYSQGFRGSSRTQVLGHEEAQRLFCHIRTLQYYK